MAQSVQEECLMGEFPYFITLASLAPHQRGYLARGQSFVDVLRTLVAFLHRLMVSTCSPSFRPQLRI